MLKYLRIAVTALSLTACVLLISLRLGLVTSRAFYSDNFEDQNSFIVHWEIVLGRTQFKLRATLPLEWSPYLVNMRTFDLFGFNLQGSRRDLFIGIPYWFLIGLCMALAATPWIRWRRRFSLRTLLIATTLVAVGLGAIVMAM